MGTILEILKAAAALAASALKLKPGPSVPEKAKRPE
jgi:hypothetical protein